MGFAVYWVAVKELDLSYCIWETTFFLLCITIMVTQATFLNSNPVYGFGLGANALLGFQQALRSAWDQ